ncbi:MAG: hypothetical protein R3B72_04645 [Polyangiaceae bacterium]
MSARDILARTSRLTLGLLLLHAALLVGRLSSARPTRPRLVEDRRATLALEKGERIDELQVLSPAHAYVAWRGRRPGAAIVDWGRSAELDEQPDLLALVRDRLSDPRPPFQTRLDADGSLDMLVGHKGQAVRWRVTPGERPTRTSVPRDLAWLRPDGSVAPNSALTVPADWPELMLGSARIAGNLVAIQPLLADENAPKPKPHSPKSMTAAVRVAPDPDKLALFDASSGAPLALLATDGLRLSQPIPARSGFAWTDASASFLRYVVCEQAPCEPRVSALRSPAEPILGFDLRPDLDRIAICGTRQLTLYAGQVDGDVRFLGKTELDTSCRSVALTSRASALVQLGKTWIQITFREAAP